MEEKNVLEIDNLSELFLYLDTQGCVTIEDAIVYLLPLKPWPELVDEWHMSANNERQLMFINCLRANLGEEYGLS